MGRVGLATGLADFLTVPSYESFDALHLFGIEIFEVVVGGTLDSVFLVFVGALDRSDVSEKSVLIY